MEEPPSYHSIQVINHSDFPVDLGQIESAVRVSLLQAEADPSDVRVLITSDEHVASLNSQFRRIAEPTDVLTFLDEEGCSGDIAIAAPYASRQATVRGISFQEEITLLSIHGALHLVGLNDETEPDRLYMIQRMYQAAEQLGIKKQHDWGSLLHREATL